jgi:hypothetical protein
MSIFSIYKIGEQEGRTGPEGGRGGGYQWEWKRGGKGCGRLNIVQKLCTHVCKWKNDTHLIYSGKGGRRA